MTPENNQLASIRDAIDAIVTEFADKVFSCYGKKVAAKWTIEQGLTTVSGGVAWHAHTNVNGAYVTLTGSTDSECIAVVVDNGNISLGVKIIDVGKILSYKKEIYMISSMCCV